MPGQNIGRATQQQNPLAEIALGFAGRMKEKQDLEESREYEEQQYAQRNPIKALQANIINEVNTKGYENVSPKTQRWYDKLKGEATGTTVAPQIPEQVPEGFQVKGYDVQGRPSYERTPDTFGAGLAPQHQFEILDIAAKMGRGKVKTIQEITPVVEKLYQQALSEGVKPEGVRDYIEDKLRYGKQSAEFSGEIREAANQLTSGFKSERQTEQFYDKLDDVVQKGDEEKVIELMRKTVYDVLPAEQSKTLKGQERTLEFLGEIKGDLAEFEAKGGKTNIFTGTFEDIVAKIGTVKDPELRKIATKILKARQQYRRAMTGVAFSEGENREYDFIFPGINRTSNFNVANLEALEEAFQGDVDFVFSRYLGEDFYRNKFKKEEQQEVSPEIQGIFDKYNLNI